MSVKICARPACEVVLDGKRFWHAAKQLYCCPTCALVLNSYSERPSCFPIREPGLYMDTDGTVGELGEFDLLSCSYTFRTSETRWRPVIRRGARSAPRTLGLVSVARLVEVTDV